MVPGSTMRARGPVRAGGIMRRVLVAALAVGMFAAPGAAQLSADYAAWADGPVMYLLTEEESRQYALLKSDEAAQRFVDLFWVQRDSDLTTRANEFRLDFEAKVLTDEMVRMLSGYLAASGGR